MSFEDPKPERRNLILMSMSIIAFYLGGGKVDPESGLELPLIKLEFHNPELLGILAWIMLGWFALRYVLEYKYIIYNTTLQHLNGASSLMKNPLFKWLVLRDLTFPDKSEIELIKWSAGMANPHKDINNYPYILSVKLTHLKDGKNREAIEVAVSPLVCFIMCIFATGRFIFTENSISAFVAPLLMFFIAIIVGVIYSIF